MIYVVQSRKFNKKLCSRWKLIWDCFSGDAIACQTMGKLGRHGQDGPLVQHWRGRVSRRVQMYQAVSNNLFQLAQSVQTSIQNG